MNFHPDKQLLQVAGAGDRTTDTLHHGGPTPRNFKSSNTTLEDFINFFVAFSEFINFNKSSNVKIKSWSNFTFKDASQIFFYVPNILNKGSENQFSCSIRKFVLLNILNRKTCYRSVNLKSRFESFHLNQKTNENIFGFFCPSLKNESIKENNGSLSCQLVNIYYQI